MYDLDLIHTDIYTSDLASPRSVLLMKMFFLILYSGTNFHCYVGPNVEQIMNSFLYILLVTKVKLLLKI